MVSSATLYFSAKRLGFNVGPTVVRPSDSDFPSPSLGTWNVVFRCRDRGWKGDVDLSRFNCFDSFSEFPIWISKPISTPDTMNPPA